MKELKCDRLRVVLADSRRQMGDCAGAEIAARIRALQKKQKKIRMIFAAAPSQNETLERLCAEPDIDWTRVEAFHMDEYVGLSADAPQCFGNFLRRAIFERLPFGSVHYLNVDAPDPDAECARYAALLNAAPIDICCLGIGENGHIAFNDPPVADFFDPFTVKTVRLDEICRLQQVHDGCFETLDAVPRYALTLTVPTLFGAHALFCSVPAPTKADAVHRMLHDPIGEACPCTILRRHADAVLYCDPDSAAKV